MDELALRDKLSDIYRLGAEDAVTFNSEVKRDKRMTAALLYVDVLTALEAERAKVARLSNALQRVLDTTGYTGPERTAAFVEAHAALDAAREG